MDVARVIRIVRKIVKSRGVTKSEDELGEKEFNAFHVKVEKSRVEDEDYIKFQDALYPFNNSKADAVARLNYLGGERNRVEEMTIRAGMFGDGDVIFRARSVTHAPCGNGAYVGSKRFEYSTSEEAERILAQIGLV